MTCDGRLFHRRAAATGNTLSPTVDRRIRRTSRDIDEAERSRRLASVSAGQRSSLTIDTGSSVEELWRESWEVKPLVNSFIIDDPTALVPGFNLPRREWCLLNRFRTGTGQCAASLLQWRYTDNPLCICGNTQSMSHIVNDCPVKKFEGGLPVVRIRQFKHKKYLIS